MRRTFITVSSVLMLLTPSIASAAFTQPSELYEAIHQENAAHSFTLIAQGGSNGTYVTLWGNGTEQGSNEGTMQMTMNTTVDVAHDGLTARFKGRLMVADGMLYLAVDSISGTDKKALAPLADFVGKKQWITFPADNDLLTAVTGTDIGLLGSTDPMEADSMFHMTSVSGPKGSTYSLNLTSDFAATISEQLLMLLGDTGGSSTDFFPWSHIADNTSYMMTISTDEAMHFEKSAFTLSMEGQNSYFRSSGTEQALSKDLALTAPKNAVSVGDILSSFSVLHFGDLPIESFMQDMSPLPILNESYEWWLPMGNSACTDGTIDPVEVVMLQRLGQCPIKKASTRL